MYSIPIHFIKMDTEGWEYNILKGGEKSLKKYKPIMQIEWNKTNMQQCDINIDNFNNFLNELGYIKHKIITEELFLIPSELI